MGSQIKLLVFRMMGFVLKNCESHIMENLNSTQSSIGSQLLNNRLSIQKRQNSSKNNFSQTNIFTSKQNYLYNDLLIACDYKYIFYFNNY